MYKEIQCSVRILGLNTQHISYYFYIRLTVEQFIFDVYPKWLKQRFAPHTHTNMSFWLTSLFLKLVRENCFKILGMLFYKKANSQIRQQCSLITFSGKEFRENNQTTCLKDEITSSTVPISVYT